MVYNPLTDLNSTRSSWDEVDILFYGENGRRRRLSLEDLGIPDALVYYDTYGAGELSPDGRDWVGKAATGMIILDLETGRWRLLPAPRSSGSGEWATGRDATLVTHHEVALRHGRVKRVPYDNWHVGHDPEGTPLSLIRRPDGAVDLIERHGDRTVTRARVAPELSPSDSRPVGVSATAGQFAISRRVGATTTVLVADSTSGAITAQLHYSTRDFLFQENDEWLDERTILLTTTPYFLAWRVLDRRHRSHGCPVAEKVAADAVPDVPSRSRLRQPSRSRPRWRARFRFALDTSEPGVRDKRSSDASSPLSCG
jgi:hypothetical protein